MSAVLAHGGFATPDTLWSLTGSEAAVVAAVLALCLGVAQSVAGRPGRLDTTDRVRLGGFCVGVTTMAVAVFSPLHRLADALFAAHMVQHLLLVSIGAPLVVRGAPVVLGRARPTDRLPLWAAPAAAAVLVVVFTLWHAPVLYEAAVRDPWVHTLEHATMVAAALVMWAAVAAAASRGHGLVAVGAIAVSGLASVALGALLALSPRPWYGVHAAGAEAWGVTPLADQQLGGMLMWIPGGSANLAAALWIVVRLLSGGEDRRGVPAAPARGTVWGTRGLDTASGPAPEGKGTPCTPGT